MSTLPSEPEHEHIQQTNAPTPPSPQTPTPSSPNSSHTSIEALDLATSRLGTQTPPATATQSQRQEWVARAYIAQSASSRPLGQQHPLGRQLPLGRVSSLRRVPAFLPLVYRAVDGVDEYGGRERRGIVYDGDGRRRRSEGGDGGVGVVVGGEEEGGGERGGEGEEEQEERGTEPTTPLLAHERPPSTLQPPTSDPEPEPEPRKIWQLSEYKIYFDRRQDRIRRGLPPSPPNHPASRITSTPREWPDHLPELGDDYPMNTTSIRARVFGPQQLGGRGRVRGGRGRGNGNADDFDDLAPVTDAMRQLALSDGRLRERWEEDEGPDYEREMRQLELDMERQEETEWQMRVHEELAFSRAVHRGRVRRRDRGGRGRGRPR